MHISMIWLWKSTRRQLIAQYTFVETPFVRFYPLMCFQMVWKISWGSRAAKLTRRQFNCVIECDTFDCAFFNVSTVKRHKKTINRVIYFCGKTLCKVWTHTKFALDSIVQSWCNKYSLCKNKLAETIKMSNHKRRQHEVDYFRANTICRLCPHIKLPHDILIMSEPT